MNRDRMRQAIAEAIYHGVNDACELSVKDCERLADEAISRYDRVVKSYIDGGQDK